MLEDVAHFAWLVRTKDMYATVIRIIICSTYDYWPSFPNPIQSQSLFDNVEPEQFRLLEQPLLAYLPCACMYSLSFIYPSLFILFLSCLFSSPPPSSFLYTIISYHTISFTLFRPSKFVLVKGTKRFWMGG